MNKGDLKRLFLDKKTYLGDSVYVHHDGYQFILETHNGLPNDPSNTICLENEVIEAFLRYRDDFERLVRLINNCDKNKDKTIREKIEISGFT